MSDFVVDLSGEAAIVTGAGDGLGRAIARALAVAGASVVVNDLNPDRCDEVAGAIQAIGGRAIPKQGDISNRFQVAALIEGARDVYGRISIFVNAASIYKGEPLSNIDEWDWRRQVDVNLTGAFFCTQLMGRVMADEGGGSILHVASTAGHGLTLPVGAAYVATKAGVVALTRQAAREWAPHRIRVNAICAGNIVGEDPTPPQWANALGRGGTTEEVASAALFLCTSAASFITGQALIVDGGEAMV